MISSLSYIAWVFIFGLCWGSFLYVCSLRIQKNQSIIYPPSHCENCEHELRWRDKIPLISWFILRAKCKYCEKNISIQYPLSEFICGFLFVCIWLVYPFSWILVPLGILLSLLFVGSYVDLHEHWIPDRCSIGLIISGLILSILFPELHKVNTPIDSLIKSFIGLFCGAGILLFVRCIGFWILKKEAMGLGDVKLLAGIGAFLGWQSIIFSIFVGSLIALIVALICLSLKNYNNSSSIPFGPYLSVAAILWILIGSECWALYLSVAFPEITI